MGGDDEGWPGRPQVTAALIGLFLHVTCGPGVGFYTEQNRFGPCPQDVSVQPVLGVPLPVRSLLFRTVHFKKNDIEHIEKRIKE